MEQQQQISHMSQYKDMARGMAALGKSQSTLDQSRQHMLQVNQMSGLLPNLAGSAIIPSQAI